MVCLVTYELKTPDWDYTPLYSYLENQMGKSAIHVLRDSWWVDVENNKDISSLADTIRNLMGEKDIFFIVDISKKPINGWLPSTSWTWLQERDKL
jgi:hypothetical protein